MKWNCNVELISYTGIIQVSIIVENVEFNLFKLINFYDVLILIFNLPLGDKGGELFSMSPLLSPELFIPKPGISTSNAPKPPDLTSRTCPLLN